ncbi:hypothetical protein L208DRAFT_1113848, partial [Tricholoma matsutake]
TLSATGFQLHLSPLECIAFSNDMVSTSAHDEVCVWSFEAKSNFMLPRTLPKPSQACHTSKPVITTSVHWASSYSSNALVVSYLYHGVVIWDVLVGNAILNFPLKTMIGDTSLSRDHRYLAVSDLTTGFDVYDLKSTQGPFQSWDNESNTKTDKLCLPVKFIHHDYAVLGGSSLGSLRFWAFD